MKKKPGSQPLRCAIYARTATVKKSDEVNSITQQVERCKCFAKEKDWIVSDEYIFTDSGQSGLRVNSGLKDLMRIAAVNPKQFEVLLCTATDRIARDTSLVIRIHETLKKIGIDIRFAEGGHPPLFFNRMTVLDRYSRCSIRSEGGLKQRIRDLGDSD